jgi:Transposase DDE domain
MVPVPCSPTAAVPPPAYQRALAKHSAGLHLDALTMVHALHLLALCQLAVGITQRACPSARPKGPGGAARVYSDASLLLIALLRTLWRLSLQDRHDWLVSWPALALACGLPADAQDRPRVPSPATLSKRAARAGAPAYEVLFVEAVRQAIRTRLIGAKDLIIDSAPIKAWRRADPDARYGHAPAHHPTAFLQGFRLHTLLCRGSGLPVAFRVAPANGHDAPCARPLLALAVHLYGLRMPVVRLDAAYWGPALIAWIHTVLGAVAVIPWNPKRTKDRSCLPPTWTRDELGKRTSIERFVGRILLFFRLQRPPLVGWTALTQQVALTYTASIIIGLAARQAGRPDLVRSPKRVLAHAWEGLVVS